MEAAIASAQNTKKLFMKFKMPPGDAGVQSVVRFRPGLTGSSLFLEGDGYLALLLKRDVSVRGEMKFV